MMIVRDLQIHWYGTRGEWIVKEKKKSNYLSARLEETVISGNAWNKNAFLF